MLFLGKNVSKFDSFSAWLKTLTNTSYIVLRVMAIIVRYVKKTLLYVTEILCSKVFVIAQGINDIHDDQQVLLTLKAVYLISSFSSALV